MWQMIRSNLFFIIEMIGTIAFACSGALVAIKKELDLLGIIVLGVTTAVGGGMIRDLLIGIHPPSLFCDPIYVFAAFTAVMLLFIGIRYSQKMTIEILESEGCDRVMNLLDAIGLGAFTVVGIDTAMEAGFSDHRFLMVFLGVITGVGGGILRDIMAGQTPAVLKKHVYACASIAGAICYVWMMDLCSDDLAMVVSACIVVVIRVLARHYKWNLPKAM